VSRYLLTKKNKLEEEKSNIIMFFDPAFEDSVKSGRKNVVVVGRVTNDKLYIIDGEVWIGAEFENDVLPRVAEIVKKWNPEVVYVQDNNFQNLLHTTMKKYHIPIQSAGVRVSKSAYEYTGKMSPEIVWKIKSDNDLLFGAGVLSKRMMGINEKVMKYIKSEKSGCDFCGKYFSVKQKNEKMIGDKKKVICNQCLRKMEEE
jgi:hypothetical protein